MTSSGDLYGPKRLQEIVKERYIISKHTNTSYVDTADITPYERQLLLNFIIEDIEAEQKALEERVKGKQE